LNTFASIDIEDWKLAIAAQHEVEYLSYKCFEYPILLTKHFNFELKIRNADKRLHTLLPIPISHFVHIEYENLIFHAQVYVKDYAIYIVKKGRDVPCSFYPCCEVDEITLIKGYSIGKPLVMRHA